MKFTVGYVPVPPKCVVIVRGESAQVRTKRRHVLGTHGAEGSSQMAMSVGAPCVPYNFDLQPTENRFVFRTRRSRQQIDGQFVRDLIPLGGPVLDMRVKTDQRRVFV